MEKELEKYHEFLSMLSDVNTKKSNIVSDLELFFNENIGSKESLMIKSEELKRDHKILQRKFSLIRTNKDQDFVNFNKEIELNLLESECQIVRIISLIK